MDTGNELGAASLKWSASLSVIDFMIIDELELEFFIVSDCEAPTSVLESGSVIVVFEM